MIFFGLGLAAVCVESLLRLAGHALQSRLESRANRSGARVILCLGESTSAPTWPKDHSWPNQLQEILDREAPSAGFTVINKAVVGTTSDVIAARIPSYFKEQNPQLVVAMFGINDNQWYSVTHRDSGGLAFLRRLKIYRLLLFLRHELFVRGAWTARPRGPAPERDKLVESILARGVPLILMQYPGLDERELEDRFAGAPGISFIDNRSSFEAALAGGTYEEYFQDRFAGHWGHCTARGDRLIAENAAKAVLARTISREPADSPRRKPARPELNIDESVLAPADGFLAGDAKKIEMEALRELNVHPKDFAALRRLVELQRATPKKALPYAERAVAAIGDRPLWQQEWAYREDALLRLRLGDRRGAERMAQRALAASPDDLQALRLMADLKGGNPAEASLYADHAARAAAAAPVWDRLAVYLESARLRRALGDRQGAEERAARALELFPDDLESLRMMLDLKSGRPSEALPYVERALQAAQAAPAWDRLAVERMAADLKRAAEEPRK